MKCLYHIKMVSVSLVYIGKLFFSNSLFMSGLCKKLNPSVIEWLWISASSCSFTVTLAFQLRCFKSLHHIFMWSGSDSFDKITLMHIVTLGSTELLKFKLLSSCILCRMRDRECRMRCWFLFITTDTQKKMWATTVNILFCCWCVLINAHEVAVHTHRLIAKLTLVRTAELADLSRFRAHYKQCWD